MKKYTTSGCKSLMADNMSDAAQTFASRIARKTFGKTAYVRTCNLESWNSNFTLGEYNAFIGYTPMEKHNKGVTVGKNVRFSVYAKEVIK